MVGRALMRVAVIQMHAAIGDVEANLARISSAAAEAAEQGADLLVAPELAITGYGAGDVIRDLAEPASGGQVDTLSAVARETGVAVVSGFAERAGDQVYNSAVLVRPDAAPVVYRKSHLYGDYERGLFTAAEPATCIADVAGCRVGLLICYDAEFPENMRRLALAGADLVAVPTAQPAGPYARTIAERMMAVRAFENQIFVVYGNHTGTEGRFTLAGLSHVAAPDGATLALAPADEEALILADIRPRDYAASRAENSYLRDLAGPGAG